MGQIDLLLGDLAGQLHPAGRVAPDLPVSNCPVEDAGEDSERADHDGRTSAARYLGNP